MRRPAICAHCGIHFVKVRNEKYHSRGCAIEAHRLRARTRLRRNQEKE